MVDRIFCFSCRVFDTSDGRNSGQIDRTFSHIGFKNWNNATSRLREHQKSKHHINSTESLANYLNSKSIDVVLEESRIKTLEQREKQRLLNRSILHRLIDITICLAKSGKPFRGHQENSTSVSKGLFLDFVDVLKKYDVTLRDHLTHGKKNASYLSNRIQNDLLQSINNVMKRKIALNVCNKSVSVCADETSDVGHYEQMAVIVRYFDDEKNKPVETFIGIQRLTSVNALSIFNNLTTKISEINVTWQLVLAVCFDGASAMSGKINGVQMKVKEVNSKIQYVHCFGHCLNLVLVDSLGNKNRVIFDFFGYIQMIYSFIECSPIRHAVLEKIAEQTNKKLKSLKSLSTTRWACRSEAIEAVDQNFNSLILCLLEIAKNTNLSDVRVKAKGLVHQIKSYHFIFSLTVLKPIMVQIRIVSASLQSPNLDLLTAVQLINGLKNALTKFRSDDNYFTSLYNKVLEVCNEHNIEIPSVKKRKISKKINDSSTQHISTDKKSEMKHFVYFVVLDDLLNGIQERFSQETLTLITAVGHLINFELSKSDITTLSTTFDLSALDIEGEYNILKSLPDFNQGSSTMVIHNWLDKLNKNDLSKSFPNIFKTLSLLVTIPVTSCSCERAFSKLNLVKNKLRNQMLQERLECLLMIFVEQEMATNLDYEEIIEEFKNLTPAIRRLEL